MGSMVSHRKEKMMKDKRVDDLLARIKALEGGHNILKRRHEGVRNRLDGLDTKLKENRCVDWDWDMPLLLHSLQNLGKARVDLPYLERRFNALVEYLDLEWQVKVAQAGFREKLGEEEVGEKEEEG